MRFVLQLNPSGPRGEASFVAFRVDGRLVEVPDDGSTLLEALRDRLGRRAPKDGCSPQGQCGCCTVWVDGSARVACVTPLRRVAGREVTTLDGIDAAERDRWVDAFVDAGASQCGFCTPGIIMRLAALYARRDPATLDDDAISSALAAHLCRCTGWRTILDAARLVRAGEEMGEVRAPDGAAAAGADSGAPTHGGRGAPVCAGPRDWDAAARRASLEGGTPQTVGRECVLGRVGFAEDTAPADALVAVPGQGGGWVVADTLHAARAAAGTVPGRNSTLPLRHPLELPAGTWAVTLRTTFVEPAYLEPDSSWCVPGGVPVTPLANGGAFGGKLASEVTAVARRLADEHGRAVRVVLTREDVVRRGPKRPPIAAAMRADGTGVVRVARTPGSPDLGPWGRALTSAGPTLAVEEVAVTGPPVSPALRGGGWVEASVLHSGLAAWRDRAVGPGRRVTVTSPEGATATAAVAADGLVSLQVAAGEPLDDVVLRSYVVGAAHQALGWVRSEGVAVDDEGNVADLTIRSFGILPARATPPVEVEVAQSPGPPVRAGDVAFAAVAGAAWVAAGLPTDWPVERTPTPR